MSQFNNHPGYGYEGQHLHAAQYLFEADRRFDKSDPSGVATRHSVSSRNLDDLGHAVNVRQVPDFWKPCEDWTLD